ncbi:uncharacterized protein LOC118487565 [Helianthus annuus]|uniref:uncharacterized protein LOC118487565 n=1 Tax=Helianthus annuus TaxID=4232 RepID=UPI0016530B02|nr:uncharacterized protein LOC118487565 [Helianthus annuus]
MDPSVLTYAAYLSGATPFVPPTFGYGQAGGSQLSQQQDEPEPDVDVVPETQTEPVQEKSKRGRRSHKKKEKDEPRRTKTHLKWTKDEEFVLTRAWLDISEDHETASFQMGPVFWDRVRALFYSTWVQGEHRDKDSISSKWTDINNKCHAFQEVYQLMSALDFIKSDDTSDVAFDDVGATPGEDAVVRGSDYRFEGSEYVNVPNVKGFTKATASKGSTRRSQRHLKG